MDSHCRSPYVPRGESSEDETPGAGEVGGDLTRSITAPSFITRDIPSREPSQDDLLGSLSSLPPGQQQGKTEGLSVINIKHALSETLVESRLEDGNVSSVHISGEERRDTVDGEEEGPFTITFKNVSAAPREFSPRIGQEPEGEDHEVVEVLQAEGVSSGRPPGHDPYLYSTNPQSFTNIHLLTGTPDSLSAREYFVNSNVASDVSGGDYYTADSRDLFSGNTQHSASLRLVRFAETKGRSEYSESSDSSAERSSSLFVECDSDRHSVSDVLSDDLNPPSAKLVVAHITDVENIVQRRALATSRSFEEVPRVFTPYIERQYSEIIPDSVYLTREHLVPSRQTENNQISGVPCENLSSVSGEQYRIVDSESNSVSAASRLSPTSEDIVITRQPSPRALDSVHDYSRDKEITSVSRSPQSKSKYSLESNHAPAITTTTTTTRAASSFTTATTTTTITTATVTSLSPSAKTSMTVTQVAGVRKSVARAIYGACDSKLKGTRFLQTMPQNRPFQYCTGAVL